MKIKIITVGNKMPKWIIDFQKDFIKKTNSFMVKLNIIEVQATKRNKNYDENTAIKKEEKEILKHIDKNDFIVLLDVKGKMFSTEDFAKKIEYWQLNNISLCFIIGGPDGVSKSIKSLSNIKISFSPMTFPHTLFRILLIEQIYRAISILKKHPYHKYFSA